MTPLRPPVVSGESAYINITEPRTGALQVRVSESAELRVAVCGACGYAEHYVDEADAARLWKYWQKGYR